MKSNNENRVVLNGLNKVIHNDDPIVESLLDSPEEGYTVVAKRKKNRIVANIVNLDLKTTENIHVLDSVMHMTNEQICYLLQLTGWSNSQILDIPNPNYSWAEDKNAMEGLSLHHQD